MNTLKANAGWMLSILIYLIGFAVNNGKQNEQISNLNKRITQIEESGSAYAREMISDSRKNIEFHERRISEIERDAKESAKLMHEIKSDLRMVVEWVKEQKQGK